MNRKPCQKEKNPEAWNMKYVYVVHNIDRPCC